MSYSKIYKIISLAVLGVFLFGVLIYGSKTKFGTDALAYSEDQYTEESVQTQDVEDISNIDVSWLAGDVSISTYDGDVIKLIENTSSEVLSSEKILAEVHNDTYEIKWNMDYNNYESDFPSYTKSLEVLIPEEMELETLTINGRSADVNVEDIFCEYVKIQATSGDISCKNIIVEDLTVSEVDGSANIDNCYSYNFKASTLSGNMDIINSTALISDVSTTSGKLNLENNFDELSLKSIDGDVDILNSMDFTKLDINSVSGEIKLTVPSTTDALFECESYSGEVKTNLTRVEEDTYKLGNGVNTMTISTTTATVSISEGSSGAEPVDEYDEIIQAIKDEEEALAEAKAAENAEE